MRKGGPAALNAAKTAAVRTAAQSESLVPAPEANSAPLSTLYLLVLCHRWFGPPRWAAETLIATCFFENEECKSNASTQCCANNPSTCRKLPSHTPGTDRPHASGRRNSRGMFSPRATHASRSSSPSEICPTHIHTSMSHIAMASRGCK